MTVPTQALQQVKCGAQHWFPQGLFIVVALNTSVYSVP